MGAFNLDASSELSYIEARVPAFVSHVDQSLDKHYPWGGGTPEVRQFPSVKGDARRGMQL